MNIRILSILPTLLMLAGCVTATAWNHPTKDEAEFDQDRYDCIKDGEQYAANEGFNGNTFIGAGRAKECMRVKGYTSTQTKGRHADELGDTVVTGH